MHRLLRPLRKHLNNIEWSERVLPLRVSVGAPN